MQTIKTVTEIEMPIEKIGMGSNSSIIMKHIGPSSTIGIKLNCHDHDPDSIYYAVKFDNLTLFGLRTAVVSAIAEAYQVEIRDERKKK